MIRYTLACLSFALPSQAESPRVVTDILPVQAIVSAIMGDIGTPDNIIVPGTSPHRASLRPSQARALEEATLIIRVGPELTPWLEESIEALAPDTAGLTLLDVVGTMTLEARDEAVFDLDDHDGHDDHGHNDHDEHKNEEHADDDHDEDEHAHDEHDDHKDDEEEHASDEHDDDHAHTDGVDPHAWMSPVNAIAWTNEIAKALASQDAANAETYMANAASSIARIKAAAQETKATLQNVQSVPFVVYHDAFQYFETYFGLNSVGAVLSGNAEAASAGRVDTVSDAAEAVQVVCIFTEPQMPERLARMLQDRHATRVAELDPMGTNAFAQSLDYADYLRYIGTSIRGCLAGDS